jgi:hypothetical protein
VDDGLFVTWFEQEATVTGEATVAEDRIDGTVTYRSVDEDGEAACDFVVAFSGLPSSRCTDCDFAFDLDSNVLTDSSGELCVPDL